MRLACEHMRGCACPGTPSMNVGGGLQATRKPSGQKSRAGPSRFKGGKGRGLEGKHWTDQEIHLGNHPAAAEPCEDALGFIAQAGPFPRNSLADQCAPRPPKHHPLSAPALPLQGSGVGSCIHGTCCHCQHPVPSGKDKAGCFLWGCIRQQRQVFALTCAPPILLFCCRCEGFSSTAPRLFAAGRFQRTTATSAGQRLSWSSSRGRRTHSQPSRWRYSHCPAHHAMPIVAATVHCGAPL